MMCVQRRKEKKSKIGKTHEYDFDDKDCILNSDGNGRFWTSQTNFVYGWINTIIGLYFTKKKNVNVSLIISLFPGT